MSRRRYSVRRALGGIRDTIARSPLGRGLRRWRARRRWSAPSQAYPSYHTEIAYRATDAGSGADLALPSRASRRLATARNLVIVYAIAALTAGGWYCYQKGLVRPAWASLRHTATVGSRTLLAAVDLDTSTSRMVLSSALAGGQAAPGATKPTPLVGDNVKRWVVASLGLTMSEPRTLVESQLADPPRPISEEEAQEVAPAVVAVADPQPQASSSTPEEPAREPQPTATPAPQPTATPATVQTATRPTVLVYHTHTSETYKDEGCSYLWEKHKPDLSSDYLWGQSQGVVTIGTELTSALEELGIQAFHSKKVHDYPDFKDAYKNALPTIEGMLSVHKDVGMVIDLHRDGLLQERSASTIVVNGESAATVFIVVTTDKFGLPHPNWKRNYAFALKLQEEINRLYPGLCRGVDLRDDARWNQQVNDHALILEVGSNLNVTKEALFTARLLARPIASALSAK